MTNKDTDTEQCECRPNFVSDKVFRVTMFSRFKVLNIAVSSSQIIYNTSKVRDSGHRFTPEILPRMQKIWRRVRLFDFVSPKLLFWHKKHNRSTWLG